MSQQTAPFQVTSSGSPSTVYFEVETKGGVTISDLLTVKNGVTVSAGNVTIAEQLTVQNGAQFSGGTVTISEPASNSADTTDSTPALSVTQSGSGPAATFSGGAVTISDLLTVKNGVTVSAGNVTIAEQLTVQNGAQFSGGTVTISEPASISADTTGSTPALSVTQTGSGPVASFSGGTVLVSDHLTVKSKAGVSADAFLSAEYDDKCYDLIGTYQGWSSANIYIAAYNKFNKRPKQNDAGENVLFGNSGTVQVSLNPGPGATSPALAVNGNTGSSTPALSVTQTGSGPAAAFNGGNVTISEQLTVQGGAQISGGQLTIFDHVWLSVTTMGQSKPALTVTQSGTGPAATLSGERYDNNNNPVLCVNAAKGSMAASFDGTVIISGKGNSTSNGMLQVSGSEKVYFSNYGYLNSSGNPGTVSDQNIYTSIWASNRIVCPEFDAVSDSRLKENTAPSDARRDSETLSKLKVTDYNFIDRIGHGDAPRKKLIAQQVRETYPDAVRPAGRGFIPDHYQPGERTEFLGASRGLVVTTRKEHGFEPGDRILILHEKGGEECSVREVRDEKTFVVPAAEDWGAVFVYGKEVDDLLAVDYAAISMLNVSATQELIRRMNAMEAFLRKKLGLGESEIGRAHP